MEKELVTDFQLTGPCTIDLDVLEKIWDHRCLLSQWREEFRFIQYLRKGSECCKVKVTISNEQAREIIKRLKLVSTEDGILRNARSWRKADWDFRSMMSKRKR